MSELKQYAAAMRNGDHDTCIAIEERHGLYGYPPELVSTVLASIDKDAEIARLRDALGKIAKGRTGLDPEESDAEWRTYWATICIDYRSIARAALAQVAEVGNG